MLLLRLVLRMYSLLFCYLSDGGSLVSRLSFTLQSDFVECEEAIGSPMNTKSSLVSVPGMLPL